MAEVREEAVGPFNDEQEEEADEEEEEIGAAGDVEEEAEEDAVTQHELNTRVLGPHDPRRMQLSAEERDWALDIKDVIEGTPEIENLSDLMCAQLAIIHKDDIVTAVDVARKLQHTREFYDIRDTLDDAKSKLKRWIKLNPGTNMSFSFSHQEGCYAHIVDLGKVDMNVLRDTDKCNLAIAGCYYQNHTYCPDLEAVRKGAIVILELEGSHWIPKRWEVEYHENYWKDVGGIYPFRFHQFHCFNTPMFFNMVKSLARPWIPKDIYSKMKTDCQFPGGRLDSVYLVPSLEAAEQRLLGRMIETLRLRYENEKTFSLAGRD